jgi:hypothetical protein
MNYCSIDEAWNNNSYSNKNVKKKPLENNLDNLNHINNNNNNIKEHFMDENTNINNNNNKHIELFTNMNQNNNICNNFMNHFASCPSCRIIVIKHCLSTLLTLMKNMVHTHKDIIVLILIGICLVLFLNIINSMTNKN